MVTKARTIEVAPGSELARLLEDPAGLPVELVKDGLRYRIDRADASDAQRAAGASTDVALESGWEGYDPERVRQVLDEVAGTLSDEEADRWIEETYRARRLDLHPDPRVRPESS